MKLFTLFNQIQASKQALDNPRQAGREFIKGIIEGYLLLYGFWLAVLLGVLGVLGFSSIFNGPYGWAEVLFYVIAGIAILVGLGLFITIKILKSKFKQLETKVKSSLATKVPVKEAKVAAKKSTRPAGTFNRLGK